jgi:hypothetical protein
MRGLADNFTLPLRGRVGPQVRGGVILFPSLTITPPPPVWAAAPPQGGGDSPPPPI